MGTQEELAKFLFLVKQDGIDIGRCCVVPQGVFINESRIAKIFSEKHDKTLVRVDGLVSGWLAQNKEQPPAEDAKASE